MANSRELNRFMKHVFRAAQRREDKKLAKESLKKQVNKVKKIAGSKRMKKDDLKAAVKELEERLSKVIEKEGDLVESAEKENRTSKKIKNKIKEKEEDV